MLNQILTLGICLASGSGLLDVREPSRAIYTNDYEIINATNSDIYLYTAWNDEDYNIEAEKTYHIPMDTNSEIQVLTKEKFDGYCYLAADSEELVTITWEQYNNQDWPWRCVIQGYEPSYGIGFYNRKTIPSTTDFFIDYNKLGIYDVKSTTATNNAGISLLPENTTIKIYKENGSSVNVSDLKLWRYKTENNVMAVCIWYSFQGVYSIIAQNFYVPLINAYANYTDFCNQAKKSNSVGPMLMYWPSASSDKSPYTNRVRFTSGYYPFVPNDQGYVDPYYFTTEDNGYIAINNDGSTAESTTFEVLTKTFEMVGKAMSTAVGFMGYMVFPGITIGFLVLLPLIISLLIVILKMVKKG